MRVEETERKRGREGTGGSGVDVYTVCVCVCSHGGFAVGGSETPAGICG